MRKFVLCLIGFTFLSWVSGLAQVPQWKVIKEFSISNGKTPVPLTVLLTPEVQGLYRISVYMAVTTSVSEFTGWDEQVSWTDLTGQLGYVDFFVTLQNGSNYQAIGAQVFSPKVGTTVTFVIQPSQPPPTDATYFTDVAIEKLTK